MTTPPEALAAVARAARAAAWGIELVAASDRRQAKIVVFGFDAGPDDFIDECLLLLRIRDLSDTGLTALLIETLGRASRGYVSVANDFALIGARGLLAQRGRADILAEVRHEGALADAMRRQMVLPAPPRAEDNLVIEVRRAVG